MCIRDRLALCHPFIGNKVLQAEDEDGGWDAESQLSGDGAPTNMEDPVSYTHLTLPTSDLV